MVVKLFRKLRKSRVFKVATLFSAQLCVYLVFLLKVCTVLHDWASERLLDDDAKSY